MRIYLVHALLVAACSPPTEAHEQKTIAVQKQAFAPTSLSVFEDHPQDRAFVLSDGSTVRLPIHNKRCLSAHFSGRAPVENVEPLLAAHALYPVMSDRSRARVHMSFLHCPEWNPERMGEFLFFIGANPWRKAESVAERLVDEMSFLSLKFPFFGQLLGDRLLPIGPFVHVLRVDSNESVLPGPEVWGWPDEKGTIEFVHDAHSFLGVLREGGAEAVRVDVDLGDKRLRGAADYDSPMKYTFRAPDKNGGFVEVDTVVQGRPKLYVFDNGDVRFSFNAGTRVGKALGELGFELENFEWDPDFNNAFGIRPAAADFEAPWRELRR